VIATAGASGSSTVTGTESVSQIVNWGCQTTIGSTLGSDGSWSMSAGSDTYTGTTTDNWGYSGSGNYSDASTVTGTLLGSPGGTYANSGNESGSIHENQTDGYTTGYSINSHWNAGNWTQTGNATDSNTEIGHWDSSAAGCYSQATHSSAGNYAVAGNTGNSFAKVR